MTGGELPLKKQKGNQSTDKQPVTVTRYLILYRYTVKLLSKIMFNPLTFNKALRGKRMTTNQINTSTLLRMPDVIKRTGFSKTTIYNKINEGIFPQRIRVGLRAMAFIGSELDAYLNALIQGKSNEQIKVLITELVSKRTGEQPQ